MEDVGDYEETSKPSLPADKLKFSTGKVQSEGANQNQEPEIDQRPRTSAAFPNDYGARPNEFNISHIERDTSLRNSSPSPLLVRANRTARDNIIEGDSDISPGMRNQSLRNLASKKKLRSTSGMDEHNHINLSYQKRVSHNYLGGFGNKQRSKTDRELRAARSVVSGVNY